MNEAIKKYWPIAAVGVLGIIAYMYLSNRGGDSSSSGFDGGYSVVNPPDNSAAVAAQAQVEGMRIGAGVQAYQSFLDYETTKENNTSTLELARINNKGALDMQALLNTRDLGLEKIDTDYQIRSIKQTGRNQRKSQAIGALAGIASYLAIAAAFCYQTTAQAEARYRPYSHGRLAA